MNKSFVMGGLTAIATFGIVSAAQADDRWPNWYIGLSGGYTYMQDEDVSGATTANKLDLNNSGFGFGGSIGYLPSTSIPLLNVMRFEAEVVYHQNEVSKIQTSAGDISGSGTYDSTAYMANAFYDLPIANSPWSPYIGAGAGVADIHLSDKSHVGNSGSEDDEFAYQFMVGIGYTPVTIPNTQWTLGYRYLATTDPKFSSPTGDIKTEYSTNSIEVGAKFRF